ncbi:hypothetical protein SALBM311S_00783 [Streptomyces alboniger]
MLSRHAPSPDTASAWQPADKVHVQADSGNRSRHSSSLTRCASRTGPAPRPAPRRPTGRAPVPGRHARCRSRAACLLRLRRQVLDDRAPARLRAVHAPRTRRTRSPGPRSSTLRSWRRTCRRCQGPQAAVRARQIARTADRAGFSYVAGRYDAAVAIPRRLASAMNTVWYDPVATLAFLAAATERVLLSHVAVVGLRHPLIGAKQYATLDHLSGGRLILGVGAGHVVEEVPRRSGSTSAGAGPSSTSRSTPCAPPSGRRVPRTPRQALRLPGPRPASPAGSGPRPPVGRRLLARRRPPGRAQGRRLAAAGDPRERLPA